MTYVTRYAYDLVIAYRLLLYIRELEKSAQIKKHRIMEPIIACIGVIGRDDNPLHVSLFPPHMDSTMEFSFLLNSCLDIFDIRQKQTSIDQDLGLLQALDERLAAYGWLTNTGIKFIVIVDLIGQPVPIGAKEPKRSAIAGLRDSDLKPVFQALQTAYIHLLQNPFYSPDNLPVATTASPTSIDIKTKFATEIKQIGDVWVAGTTSGA